MYDGFMPLVLFVPLWCDIKILLYFGRMIERVYMENTFGKYRIAAPLTAKVSNPTYRARLLTAPEWNCVVKVYNEHKLHSQQAQEEWLRRMDELIRLEHSHILSVTCGIEDEVPYHIAEYQKRGSLRERLRQVMSAQEIKKIILHVGQALQYAHEHHILHGNIKPENVLFGENGDVLLADFCVPRDPDETDHLLPAIERSLKTAENAANGRDEVQLTYYVPEETLSEKSDQHALGFLAYEMLNSYPETIIASTRPPSKETQPGDFSSAQAWVVHTKAVVRRALAKEPGERYENVAALLKAIEEPAPHQLAIIPNTELLLATRPAEMKMLAPPRPMISYINVYQSKLLISRLTKTLQLYQRRVGWRGGVIIAALFVLGIFYLLLNWQPSISLQPEIATASSASPVVTPQATNSQSLQRISTSTPTTYIDATVSTLSGSATSTHPQSHNPSPPNGSSSSNDSYGSSPRSQNGSSSSGGSSRSYNGGGSSSGSSPKLDPTPAPTFTPTPTPAPKPTPKTMSRPSRHCFWGPFCNSGGGGFGGGFGGGGRGFGGRGIR
jgi:serine/threonine protein kinase